MVDTASDPSVEVRTLAARAAVLLSQASGQLADLRQALAAAPAGSTLQSRLAASAAQTSSAIGVLSQSGTALRHTDLAALESVVFSGEAASLVAEISGQAAGTAAAQAAVAGAATATRQEAQSLAHDVFDRKIFDPYLHFASAQDEADYRKREDEARRYVERQLARGTPEGDLNAGGGMMGQLLDAHAHGAGDSPDFLPRWRALAEKVEHQHAAMRAAGQSTDEFDRNMATSVRRFLAAKGLSEAEIDKRLASAADPLRAVEPFIADDADSRHFENLASGTLTRTTASSPHAEILALPRVVASDGPPGSPAPPAIDFGAMNARLEAAGLHMTAPLEPSGHGLPATRPTPTPGMQIGG